MSEITNRAAYLKGLADGLKLDTEKAEGRLIAELISLVGDIADQVEAIDDEQMFIEDKLDEVLEVPDRILVMYEGEIVGELNPKETTPEELGLYMAGAKREGKA